MLRKLIILCLTIIIFTIPTVAQEAITELQPEVLNTYPHNPDAFTQGLIWVDGVFYESTGLRGASSLREVEIETGDVVRSVPLTRGEEALADGEIEYFGEGLALVDDRLIQLTWQAGEAIVYDFETFDVIDTYEYAGEGWGLCYDERFLYLSDGTPYLSIYTADTFELVVQYLVTFQGAPIQSGLLNELECVGDSIYANLWRTDFIVEIDKFTGEVISLIDASSLLTDEERDNYEAGRQVLNGIAYNPETETFFVTGKEWDTMYEVQFVPVEE